VLLLHLQKAEVVEHQDDQPTYLSDRPQPPEGSGLSTLSQTWAWFAFPPEP
jgi:hypothetical protein